MFPRIDLSPGRYVALGDSYSAGEGLAPFVEGTGDLDDGGDRCHRSNQYAYPLKLRFVNPTRRLFRACSGAEVEHVFDEVQRHDGVSSEQGLQVKAGVLTPDVVLITVTMGGNDLDFAKVLDRCFHTSRCVDKPYRGEESLRQWVESQLGPLGDQLAAMYGRLRAEAPTEARVLVMGYPALFPERAPPVFDPQYADCTLLLTRWSGSERQAIREWGLDLNKVIQRTAYGSGVEYVDTHSHFVTHEPCGTGGQWVRLVGISRDSAIRDGSFHPRRVGQGMFAGIVSCYLSVHRAPNVGGAADADKDTELSNCVASGQPEQT